MATTQQVRLAVRVTFIGVLAIGSVLGAQSTRTVQDSSRPAPFVIAVLADNFTAADVDEFNEVVDNLFTYGLLATAPFMGNRDAFRVVTVFHPEASDSAPSRYGFTMQTDPASNCSVSWAADTGTRIFADQSEVPDARFAVVVGNYNYTFGCRNDHWAYVAKGSVGHPIIEHEIGHLVFGLLDEFAYANNTRPPVPVRGNLNCSRAATPYWMNNTDFPYAQKLPACDGFADDIWHAFHECKMGSYGDDFCPVCSKILVTEIGCALGNGECEGASGDGAQIHPRVRDADLMLATSRTPVAPAKLFQALKPAAPAQPANREVLRLLLGVNASPNSPVAVLSAIDSKGSGGNHERRVGDYVYEVTDGTNTLAVGVLPGDPFQARSYRGGLTEHAANAQATASIVVTIPGETRGRVLDAKRNVSVTFYKLSPELNIMRISPGVIQKLRGTADLQQHAQLTAQQLREGIELAQKRAQK